jgi:hypothetical protein
MYYVESEIAQADYILLKTGQNIDTYFAKENYMTVAVMRDLFEQQVDISKYYAEVAKIWVYQDSSEVIVLRKVKDMENTELERLRREFIRIYQSKDKQL